MPPEAFAAGPDGLAGRFWPSAGRSGSESRRRDEDGSPPHAVEEDPAIGTDDPAGRDQTLKPWPTAILAKLRVNVGWWVEASRFFLILMTLFPFRPEPRRP